MTVSILKWGAIGGLIMSVLATFGYWAFPLDNPTTFQLAAYTGYLGMFLGLAMIWPALSDAKNRLPDTLQLLPAIGIGVGVALVAGVIFGLFNVFYSQVFAPDFLENYYAQELAHAGLSEGPEYEEKAEQLNATRDFLKQPLNGFFAMASAAWALGLVFALVLPFVHRRIHKK
ncbi:DUF4199 domain-containing protein [Maritalea mediterranea]|uniref:DUF4199 domain-containing protein n=1 Tax=Maritalea mediterranea TaxID=2909667 RepID=A0ABS9ECW0_9HYPH|nr:DUF4199 domain-containing protein [Maritalea mediterranea]MCF4099286.1 DUF4199 domain-containing protein [Maritalea mediterranea]